MAGRCPFSGNVGQEQGRSELPTGSRTRAGDPMAAAGQRTVSRRGFLGGAIAAAGAMAVIPRPSVASATSPSPTPAPPAPLPPVVGLPRGVGADGRKLPGMVRWKHAVGDPRGSDVVAVYGRTKEARYGAMFKDLSAFVPDDKLLIDLAQHMTEARGPVDDIVGDGLDNYSMPSGYIYLGQFIDHDMTLDTTPLGTQQLDPHALTNYDTPRFDLGSVYGQGPAVNPELYDTDKNHLLLVTNAAGLTDLPRGANGVAFVGDPRNDENLITSQLQQVFIRLHNHFLDHDAKGNFARAQQLTRWHYQWVIVHDYLPRLVGQSVVDGMLAASGSKVRANTLFFKPANPLRPMMPIEYAVAAYRWGHSGIRPEYEMHDSPLSPNPAVLPIFNGDTNNATARDLRGSRPLYPDAQVDWNYFFEIPGVDDPDDRNLARLIDTYVSRPLQQLPDTVVAHTSDAILALAERNLLRGKRLGLPSGQDVAARMRKTLPSLPAPLSNTDLGLDATWGGAAPLWYYCLKEAELGGGQQLGPVAGRLVAEVILGLLQCDQSSYFNATPTKFTPVGGPGFRMGDLIALAGAPFSTFVELPDPLVFAESRGVIEFGG